jgi:hypothetical protein
MSEQDSKSDEQERIRMGQSAARGATGDGQTGVAPDRQGISNRPGDAGAVLDEDEELEAQDDEAEEDDEGENGDENPAVEPR